MEQGNRVVEPEPTVDSATCEHAIQVRKGRRTQWDREVSNISRDQQNQPPRGKRRKLNLPRVETRDIREFMMGPTNSSEPIPQDPQDPDVPGVGAGGGRQGHHHQSHQAYH